MKTKILIVTVAIISLFSSCKKGTNDPFLSLKSRKARVIGEWVASSVKFTNTNTANNITTTNTYVYGSGTWTFTNSFGTQTGIASYEVVFLKDGTYSMTTVQDDQRTVVDGTWNFSGKVGDGKNKDHLIMTTTKETTIDGFGTSITTYVVNTYDGSYYLDELGSKKMVWKMTNNNVDTYTPQGGTSNTTSGTSESEYVWEIK